MLSLNGCVIILNASNYISGTIQLLSICGSFFSIILNVEMGNAFGDDLDLGLCSSILFKILQLRIMLIQSLFS